jgi:hypothetical protein
MVTDRDKVLSILRLNGPVIPIQIAKEIGTNILIASAMLSELVSNSLVRISSVKVGGSPLYYMQGQEEKLQEYSKNLHEKEKKVYELLKQEKVLRDIVLQPVERVALREIKDYAKPLKVKINESEEIFWKWYLLSNEEAESSIRNLISKSEMSREKEKPKVEPKKETEQKKEYLLERPEPKKSEPAPPRSVEKEQQRLFVDDGENDLFLRKVRQFFELARIEILEQSMIKNNVEIDFVVNIPSAVGGLKYYCKAKNKKKCSDSDISEAYMKGSAKKLPVIFVLSGDLTKKAKDVLNSDFKGIIVKKI